MALSRKKHHQVQEKVSMAHKCSQESLKKAKRLLSENGCFAQKRRTKRNTNTGRRNVADNKECKEYDMCMVKIIKENKHFFKYTNSRKAAREAVGML